MTTRTTFQPGNQIGPLPPAAPPESPVPAEQIPAETPGGADPIGDQDGETTGESVLLDPGSDGTDGVQQVSVERPWWDLSTRNDGSKSMVPGMLMAMGVLLMVFILMRRVIRNASRRPPALQPDERLSAIHDRAIASITPLEKAISDAEQLARRLAATMDNKADRLDILIQEADRKLEQLNQAVAHAARSTPTTIDRPFRPGRSIDPSLMDRARVEQDREERGTPRPTPSEPAVAAPAANDRPTPDPVHRRVWALADDGMPPVEIARSLNQPVGQVELILNLRKSG